MRRKRDFPVDRTREHLEPGPIVLISSAYKGARNIMTLGWHMMLEYDVVACYVWDANHSYEMFRRSRECVITCRPLEEGRGGTKGTPFRFG